ncbi:MULTISPECIES: cellulase family glycosylhydrolase [Streptomyces]|uniref:Endoglucanase D n=1 Tax=Streptomyces chartreusis NRRL 3882 TaxID=1079985 RepID=A0A2N9BLP2_STRCX|nr:MULTISPECIES: cellulase family glycosylhydrolase [Streptomyces]MYS88655.1 cellulase family glycosylhydrolase [Streptomyces sp. SID5464]SOR84278.1 Endoglucanase D precursor [Streptomyces chartreusis NRRL 3882]
MKDLPRPAHHRSPRPGRLPSLLLVLAVMLGLAGGTSTAATDDTAEPSRSAVRVPARAMDAVAAMQPSWNLGNTLDAIPHETNWGNPKATRELFATIRGQGFRSVRIPVTWSDHQSATAPYTVDAAYMSRVKEVVDWALDEGLYVVLNVHHDSWQWIDDMPADHDGVLARFNSTWTQISQTFRDEPRTLIFESVNEPVFEKTTADQKVTFLRELNTSFHKVVRSSGGGNTDRLLMLPTEACTPSQNLMDDLYTTIKSLNDRNLVATVHYYSWYPFSVNVAGGTHYDDKAQNDLNDAFARMRDTFVARGIPVYLGEYGLLGYPDTNHPSRVERGEALKYYEHLGHAARSVGVTTALWDPGTWAYLNRETQKWSDPALFAWIKSSWTTRSGTASFDKVFVPKSEPITAKGLTLHPNGTRFRGLWHGRTKLVEGRDYTLFDKTRLVLTAGALTRLTGDREYGVNATLQARFSRGLPWQIEVVTYDEPVLSDATGRTDAFTIPTQYRGDVLATMEARYGDGSNAGQTDWTPYQEFNKSFSPDYGKDTIILQPEFLDALRDGEPVTLTFHFYSGEKLMYHVKKSGDSVTGSRVTPAS